MPTYNQAEFLDKALDSWFAQTYEDKHLVAVDDGSSDSTARVLRRRQVDVIEHPENLGTARAINSGINYLTGDKSEEFDALSWISSDNIMRADWLEQLVGIMESWCDVGVAYAGFHYCQPGQPPRYLFKDHKPDQLIDDVNCYYGPAFLIRRDVWLKAGEHRGKISHDYDHWLRVEEACWQLGRRIIGTAHPLCEYSAHDKRVTVIRRHEFDAHHWQAEARGRRGHH